MNKSVRFITETGAMIAILLVVQLLTKMAGQYVTGSLVNMVLALSVALCSLGTGIVVAVASPFLAFALGIGPAFLPLVPAIALGNLALVLVSYLFIGMAHDARNQKRFLALLAPAIIKFATLYILVAKLIVPSLGLEPGKAATISAMFSYPQLVTALVGMCLASLIAGRVKKAIGK